MNVWPIILVCFFCWLHGAMYGWIFRELREKKQFLEKAKEADRLLDNASKSYKLALNILRTLDGVALILKCEEIVNRKEEL